MNVQDYEHVMKNWNLFISSSKIYVLVFIFSHNDVLIIRNALSHYGILIFRQKFVITLQCFVVGNRAISQGL